MQRLASVRAAWWRIRSRDQQRWIMLRSQPWPLHIHHSCLSHDELLELWPLWFSASWAFSVPLAFYMNALTNDTEVIVVALTAVIEMLSSSRVRISGTDAGCCGVVQRAANLFISAEALVKAVSVQDLRLIYSCCCRSSDWAVNKLQRGANSWRIRHGIPARLG